MQHCLNYSWFTLPLNTRPLRRKAGCSVPFKLPCPSAREVAVMMQKAALRDKTTSTGRRISSRASPCACAASQSADGPPAISHGSLVPRVILQLVQLLLVLAVLLLIPAKIFAGKVSRLNWMLYLVYTIFFSVGSLQRILKYGSLASRSNDAQVRTKGRLVAFLLFIGAMPAGHWLAVYDSVKVGSPTTNWSLGSLLLGSLLITTALAVHVAAAKALGRSYDRLVTPDQLVTWGPYSLMQHPIYTSYICLFMGYCLMLQSPRAAALLGSVCLLYYSQRTAIESHILEAAFGVQYKRYSQRTARFIPLLL
eukprot:jgi/Botrbrau1/4780/Bobra.0325s0003.1